MRSANQSGCLWRLAGPLLIVCFLQTTYAGFERSCPSTFRASPQGFCGPLLSDLLASICSVYNKRSDPSMTNVHSPAAPLSQHGDSSVFMPRHQATALLNKRHAAASITCECCIHRCTIYELASYCSAVDYGKRSSPIGGMRTIDALLPSHRSQTLLDSEREDLVAKRAIGGDMLKMGKSWWNDVTHVLPATWENGAKSRHEGTFKNRFLSSAIYGKLFQ